VAALRLVAAGGYGSPLQIVLLLLAALSVAALAVGLTRVTTAVRAAARRTRAHAQAARLAAGGSPPGPTAPVIDSASPPCMHGRPTRYTVITTAASISSPNVSWPLSLHTSTRTWPGGTTRCSRDRALGRVLGPVRLFSTARRHRRLLEMCADDSRRPPAPPGEPSPTRSSRWPCRPLVAVEHASGGARSGECGRGPAGGAAVVPPAAGPARAGLSALLGAVVLGPAVMAAMTTLVPMLCGR